MFLRRRLPSCPTGATMIKSRGKVPAAKTSLLSEQKQRKHEDDELQKAAARGAAFEKCLSRKFASCVHRRRKEKLTRRKKISYIAVKGCPRIRVWLEIFFSLFVFVLLCFLSLFCEVRHQRTGVSIPLYGNAVARCRRRLRNIGFRLLWCRSAFLSVVCYGVCVSSASGFCEKFAFVSIFVSPIEVSCLMFGQ